ncbi:hypothetical protein SOVF_084700 [Spinacia oleracea]|nr:hypothetical protein SOVF_084700 [Spinacia oleracea]
MVLTKTQENKSDRARPPLLGETPWLLYTKTSGRKQTQTFYSPSSSSSSSGHHKNLPQLHNKQIVSTAHGWLILRNLPTGKYFSMFNPDTCQFISLPVLLDEPADGRLSGLSLTTPPESNHEDCLFLLCYSKAGIMCFCRPLQRNCRWVTQKLKLQGNRINVKDTFTVKGIIYGSGDVFCKNGRTQLQSFYVRDDDSTSLTLRPLQIPASPAQSFGSRNQVCKQWMVDSVDCRYCVRIFFNYYYGYDEWHFVGLKVFELDIDAQIWREINSLGGRTFFLNHRYGHSTWCWGTKNNESGSSRGCIQGDCVYFLFPTTSTPPLSLFMYNLRDQTFMLLSPGSNLSTTSEAHVWLIPRLLSSEKWKEGLQEDGLQLHHEVGQNENQLDLEIERHESMFNELPLHLIELITKHMHLFEYWNFRACCKTYHSLCPKPQWGTNNDLPLFMSFKSNNGLCQLIDPCRLGSYSKILQFLPDTIVFSKNGWVLALVCGQSLEFFNVFSGVKGDFPTFGNIDLGFKSISFSTNPTCSECLTVGMCASEGDYVLIYYLQSGNEYWNSYSAEDYAVQFYASTSPPIVREGAFYFLDTRGYLGVFQLVEGKPDWQIYTQPHFIVDQFAQYSCYLVECAGTIHSVFVDNRLGMPIIKVFKLNDTTKYWDEIHNLGNHVLFISRASCLSRVTSDPKMKNRIYLPRLQGETVVYYSLETKTYHYLGSDNPMVHLYGTKEPVKCCWI